MFTFTKVAAVTQRSDRSNSLWCLCITLLTTVVCAGCTPDHEWPENGVSLSEARSGFVTDLLPQTREGTPAPKAPPSIFRTVKYLGAERRTDGLFVARPRRRHTASGHYLDHGRRLQLDR